jgi:hypothetical protein
MSKAEFNQFLVGWRRDLRQALVNDPKGFLGRKYSNVAASVTEQFPDYDVVAHYVRPLTTFSTGGGGPTVPDVESYQPHLSLLCTFCKQRFGWTYDDIICSIRTEIWQGAYTRAACKVSKSQL